MKIRNLVGVSFIVVCLTLYVAAQQATMQPTTPSAGSVVPSVINFSGALTDLNGRPLTGIQGVTFLLYNTQEGGSPVWLETQNITPGRNGGYTVTLGTTTSQGLPADLFSSGEARWLAVQVSGQPEQPRVLLVAVPYALKAADAQTIGGLPPSAFVLASPLMAGSGTPSSPSSPNANAVPIASPTPPTGATRSDVTTTGGTANAIPLFTTSTNIQNSLLTQTGTTSISVGGKLNLPTTGTATASKGFNSQPNDLVASAYNSSSKTAVAQTFQLQAEPSGNDTAAPSGTLNLLYGSGTTAPSETGLKIGSKGLLTFASGQTFPGTGTITGITTASGSGLTGGGNSGSLSLKLISTCAKSQVLQWNGSTWACSSAGTGTITGVTAGTDLTGGGTSGNVTLSLNTSALNSTYAQLAAANTFTGNQTMSGNLSATGTVSGSSFQIGSSLFAFGSATNANAFLGFAGNATTTGTWNTGTGAAALLNNTTGTSNTASGYQALATNSSGSSSTATGVYALANNSSGSNNTATGGAALFSNTTGADNAALGLQALYSNGTGFNNTAIGYEALFSNSTACCNTAVGYAALVNNVVVEGAADASWNNAFGYEALYSNTTGVENDAFGFQTLFSNTTGPSNSGFGDGALYSNTTGSANTGVGWGALGDNTTGSSLTCVGYNCTTSAPNLTNATAIGAHAVVGQSNSLVLGGTGNYGVKVGIGTTSPSNVLTIARGAGHPVSDSWETYSSRRWKTNIHPLQNALTKVEQLRGVSYDLKDSGKHEIGVIAEEVGKVVPEVVSYEGTGKDASGVDYSRLTALLIEAVKQQQNEISTLRSQLRTRATKEAALEARLRRLEQQRGDAQVASAKPPR